MISIISLAAAVCLMSTHAECATPDITIADSRTGDSVTDAAQEIGRDMSAIMRVACRGGLDKHNELEGLPGNFQDNTRCRSIVTKTAQCYGLAVESAVLKQAVMVGRSTYSQLWAQEDQGTNDPSDFSSSIVIAQSAPSNLAPAQLLKFVWQSCLKAH